MGIALFSRILSWLFQKYKHTTYAVLTGFVFGSLNKIWPWKRAVLGQDEFGDLIDLSERENVPEGIRVFREENLSPFQDRKSTRLNSSHVAISYAVFCL